MASTKASGPSPRPARCCPRFDPAPWQDQRLVWHDKLFLKARVHCLWHVPLDIDRTLRRAYARIDAAGASPAQPLFLSDDVSPWYSDLYLEITKEIADRALVRLSGSYITKVFEGPFHDAPKWLQAMQAHVAGRGGKVEKMYLGYTTCPQCAKAYGKNYVIVLARLA